MSHIRIENEYLRTPEFIKFLKLTKGRCFFFILAAVIRESDTSKDDSSGANYIYNEHFLKGELVGRYSQEDIAEYIMSSQGRVSRCLKELESDGMIKKIERFNNKGSALYYQVGIWEGKLNTPSYKETLWFDEIFMAYSKIAKQKRGDRRPPQFGSLKDMVHLLNKNHKDYEKLKAEWLRG